MRTDTKPSPLLYVTSTTSQWPVSLPYFFLTCSQRLNSLHSNYSLSLYPLLTLKLPLPIPLSHSPFPVLSQVRSPQLQLYSAGKVSRPWVLDSYLQTASRMVRHCIHSLSCNIHSIMRLCALILLYFGLFKRLNTFHVCDNTSGSTPRCAHTSHLVLHGTSKSLSTLPPSLPTTRLLSLP